MTEQLNWTELSVYSGQDLLVMVQTNCLPQESKKCSSDSNPVLFGLGFTSFIFLIIRLSISILGFPGGSVVKKNPPANAGDAEDLGLILSPGRSPAEGNGNTLQYSCLENSMDRGAWWATVYGVAKSWTQLSTHLTVSIFYILSTIFFIAIRVCIILVFCYYPIFYLMIQICILILSINLPLLRWGWVWRDDGA